MRLSNPNTTQHVRPRIVDSTLREGEQFARAHFSSADRLEIARALDAFGVDLIEMTSPAASRRSAADLGLVAGAGLRARVVTHVRCHPDDVRAAIDCGAQGVQLFLGSSDLLRTHGHGRSLPRMLTDLAEVLELAHAAGIPARFSCEDAFRTPREDLVKLCWGAQSLGAVRVGLADTVGRATPEMVTEVVSAVREVVDCEIEFHGHNDGGCAVANAWSAWRAGATHIDTTVLGVGERNGITPLAGLIARMVLHDPTSCADLRLTRLVGLDQLLAGKLGIAIPHDACISAPEAFTHMAGLHAKAVLSDPHSYESLDPAMFGRERSIPLGHRLIGRHALAARAASLGLRLPDGAIAAVTAEVKRRADDGPLDASQVDTLLRAAAPPAPDLSHRIDPNFSAPITAALELPS